MKKKPFPVRQMVLTGLLSAILCVLSILEIPMPTGVPITLQTFAVALCGYVMGWKTGAFSAALYVLLGAIGVPVFSGMSGGAGFLIGPTGGFLFGFPVLAALCGLGIEKYGRQFKGRAFLCGLAGLFLCHLAGVLQFSVVTGTGFTQSFFLASAPYLVKDGLCLVGAGLVAAGVRKGLAAASLTAHGN